MEKGPWDVVDFGRVVMDCEKKCEEGVKEEEKGTSKIGGYC